MPHPLEDKLADLRRRVRLLAVIHGISAIVGSVFAAAIILGLTDYLFRFQDRGLRVFASLALFGALGWACYRYFYLPAVVRFRDVDLAIKLQRRFPELEDRLLSAVEFIAQDEDDPTAGSPALRRSVIARTTAETEDIDFNRVIDRRPVVFCVLLSAAICLAAAVLAILDPAASRTAVARLVNPLNNAAWPQKNRLAIRRPVECVGRGQEFEVEAVDALGAPLPAEVYIHYRFNGADGIPVEESVLMPQVGKAAFARRENIVRGFSYRVTGGDDLSMPWLPVEVIQQPAVQSLSIRLLPPSYTGWPAETSENNIRALKGTRLEIEAVATKPLKAAAFCLEDGREFAGRLSADGLHIAFTDAALAVEKSGSYWFRLTDRQNLVGGENDRWEIVAVADAPPSVTIEQPTANLYVTPQAVVPLRIAAKDDLAIREVVLAFSQSASLPSSDQPSVGARRGAGGEGLSVSKRENNTSSDTTALTLALSQNERGLSESILPLYAGPPQIPPQVTGGLSQPAESGQLEVVEYRWPLEALRLVPGMEVVFQAIASDYVPQSTRSEPRRLLVVTPVEIQNRIAGRQTLLLSELDRVLKMQRAARAQIEAAEISLDESKPLEQPELDRLRTAELGQRQVNVALTSRGEGVPSHVFAMLADLENNRIDNPELTRRLHLVLEEIQRIEREYLLQIGRELTFAAKSAEIALSEPAATAGAGAEVAAALATAGKNQDQVISSLEKLIAQLTQSGGNLGFQRDLSQLLREQEDTLRRTAEVGRRTLGRDIKDLSTQDAAELRIIASGEFDHARSLERILQDMERSAAELRENDPLAAKIVAIALDQAGRMGIDGQMRSCGDNLRQNQIGQAAELQKSIVENLRQIIDILIHQSTRESSTADELARLENSVKNLRGQQQNICDQTRHFEQLRLAQGQFNRTQLAALVDLARMQRSLQIDSLRLGEQISSAAFALALEGASRDMDHAASLLERRLTSAETQQAQQNALSRLNLLLEALKPEPPENQQNAAANAGNQAPAAAQQPLNQPQSTVSLSELKMLKILQQDVNRRTAALSEAIGPNGKPNDQQRHEYSELAEEQSHLAELILKITNTK